MVTGPWRDGKVHVLAVKCSTCIFRPGNLMHLRPGRRDSMVQECIDQNSAIPCHETLDDKRAICRGFYDVHAPDIFVLRMARGMDVIEFTGREEP